MSDKEPTKPCHFAHLHFKDKHGLGLKGNTKYDQCFLEELEIHKLKNTDLAIKTLKNFCTEKKVNYTLYLMDDNNIGERKVIYKKK